MSKKIYPGNYVAHLSSYQTQGVTAEPGRVYYNQVGYALVTSTGATEFDVIIPSPDLRNDDKPRADRTGLTIPQGAVVYAVNLRVPDLRKDTSKGTANSYLVGTNTDTIALKDAAASNAGAITPTIVSTGTIAVASGTIAPATASTMQVGGNESALTGAETLKVFVRNAAGTGTGSALSSTATGGTPLICEVCYYVADEPAGLDEIHRGYQVEAGAS